MPVIQGIVDCMSSTQQLNPGLGHGCLDGGRRSGLAGLAESVSASSLSMSAAVFDPLDSQDGKITAKLRPKEDSDCGPCGAAPLCRQRFVRRAFRPRTSRSGRSRCSPVRPSTPYHVELTTARAEAGSAAQ